MRRVSGEVALARLDRARERVLEERERSFAVAGRAVHAAAFELEANVRHSVVPGERLRLIEQPRAPLEVPAQPLHSRQLSQNLRAAGGDRLLCELLAEAPLARVEIVEIPERAEPVGQSRRSEPNQVIVAPVATVPTHVGHEPQHAGAASAHRSANGAIR